MQSTTFLRNAARPGFWNDARNHRKFIEDLAVKVKIDDKRKEWPILLTRKLLDENGGSTLHRKYKGIRELLETIYPNEEFIFKRKPRNYWDNIDNQRKFMDQYMIDNNITSLDDWNHVRVIDFKKNGGRGILEKYPNFFNLLETIFPDHTWNIDKRKQKPYKYWNVEENRRKYIKKQVKKAGIDWKLIPTTKILDKNSRVLLNYYSTTFDALKDSFPELNVMELKSVPNNFWNKMENQREYFDNLSKKLKLKSLQDWNSVNTSTVLDNNGHWVFSKYANLFEALSSIYPEFSWKENERIRVPRNYWKSKENCKKFLDEFSKYYQIENPDDWYRISTFQIAQFGGSGLLYTYNGLIGVLEEFYSSVSWNRQLLNAKDKKSAQRWLYLQTKTLFPNIEIIEDYLFPSERNSGVSLEFDIFIPSLNLALEYNGFHHYHEIPSFGSLESYKRRDIEKEQMAKKHNITLKIIPFTWDGKIASLQEILHPFSNTAQC